MRPVFLPDGTPNPDLITYDATSVACHACRKTGEAARVLAGRDDSDPLVGVQWRTERN